MPSRPVAGSDPVPAAAPDCLIRPEIAALRAYCAPPRRAVMRLDAMENPHPWPEEMHREWSRRLADLSVNRYPDADAGELQQALRTAMGIEAVHALLLGNGSDEIIQIIAMSLARPGAVMLVPEPGFVMYPMVAAFTGMRCVGVPLAADFGLDMAAMRAAIVREKPALIFLACPNNPTGNLFREQDVEEILRLAPGVVVIDEAYQPFADHSFLSRLSRHANALLMRTVSKMGLAGLRLGYLIGSPLWLEQFAKVRLPYNINVLTQAAVVFALRHKDLFDRQAAAICAERDKLYMTLSGIAGLRVYPSVANFLLLRVATDADALHAHLLAAGILVKNLHGTGRRLENCLRVTVGTAAQNEALAQAIQDFFAA